MERIIKLFLLVFLISASTLSVLAAPAATSTYNPFGTPVKVSLPQCIKTFNTGYDKLFFLTEAAVSNNNNYNVEEIQTQGGYIVFTAGGYKFLATVISFGSNKAILKITPCNNNYTFPPLIIKNVFRYVEANQYKKF